MIKKLEDVEKEIRRVGEISKQKAEELKEMVEHGPKVIRIFEAHSKLCTYTADTLAQISGSYVGTLTLREKTYPTLDHIVSATSWKSPTKEAIYAAGTSVTSYTTAISSSIMPEIIRQTGTKADYFGAIPTEYKRLKLTDDLVTLLNKLDGKLAESWRLAWDSLSTDSSGSLKNAATYARTVVDEVSWKPPSEHLLSLSWCELDEKKRPTRATRFCWIRYGDRLPASLTSVSSDPSYIALRKSYDRLHKFVHRPIYGKDMKLSLEFNVKTIETALIDYLGIGIDRIIDNTTKS